MSPGPFTSLFRLASSVSIKSREIKGPGYEARNDAESQFCRNTMI